MSGPSLSDMEFVTRGDFLSTAPAFEIGGRPGRVATIGAWPTSTRSRWTNS
jgi:hypothetical protein